MKRRHISIAALAIAGALFAAPLAAGADPVIGITGVSGGSTSVGDTVTVTGSGCTIPGQPTTYVGEFISLDQTNWAQFSESSTTDGTWQWVDNLDPSTMVGTVYSMIYCSTAPVTNGINDGNIQWESPVYTTTIQAADDSGNGRMALTKAATSRFATSGTSKARDAAVSITSDDTGDGPTTTLDINALPRIDKMGLPAAQADALKAEVDANFANISQAVRLYKAYFGTYGDQASLQPYINMLNAGSTPAVVSNKFNGTAQVKAELVPLTYMAEIDQIYMNLFGTKADAATNAYWTAQLRAKVKVPDMVLAIANSDDAHNAIDNAAYVIAAELTLGKPVTSEAATDALAAPLNAQQETKVQLVEDIALG